METRTEVDAPDGVHLAVRGLGKSFGATRALDDNNAALIDDATKAKVDELSAKIQSGEIQVHDYTTDSTCPGA